MKRRRNTVTPFGIISMMKAIEGRDKIEVEKNRKEGKGK